MGKDKQAGYTIYREPPDQGQHHRYERGQVETMGLLADLLRQPVEAQSRSEPRPRPRRTFRTLYERMLARSALVVALLLSAGIYLVGWRQNDAGMAR